MDAKLRRVPVHVVSDSTGFATEKMISQVLAQFRKDIEPVLERRAFVKDSRQLLRILDQADSVGGVLIYSLLNRRLLEVMQRETPRPHLEIIDLLGPLIERLAQVLDARPSLEPVMTAVRLEDESMRLAQAIDFTLRHDDGQNIETLGLADVVILGVSRVSKTPTSLYLSCNHGLKVANVPIVQGMEPPAKLFTLRRPTMVGLTIEAEKLAMIRQKRFKDSNLAGYWELSHVRRELTYCHEIFARIGMLRIVDVTNRSIEDVAKLIPWPGTTPFQPAFPKQTAEARVHTRVARPQARSRRSRKK
ncbi:MAG: pyruvate, phosphate dikinase/phosphoenolpyruvate synthase regulator [Desulfarculus sp.]|nr:pyruvate, phosphate dikinase/phosphoenolpyruvate synthase regulator [Desulfarculus sp.]